MGNISNATAIHGLTASGATTSTNVSGSVTLGKTQEQVTLLGADVFFSSSITSTGATDVATLDLTTGVIAQTTGTPTITDGDGKDFEGETLGTMAKVSALHVVFNEVASGVVAMSCADVSLPDVTASINGTIAVITIPDGKTLSGNTITFTFNDASSQKVTIIATGVTS
jgi:hypothetical protein